MEPDEPILKEAANLIFSTWQEDGRFRIYPKGGIYPCQTAIAANVLCHMGYVNDERIQKTLRYFWTRPITMAAGDVINFPLDVGKRPNTPIRSPR